MVAAALRAGSDGVIIPYQMADRHLRRAPLLRLLLHWGQ